MADDDETEPARARSTDGTEIAYWTTGSGPPLVLVHGVTADHTRWRPLLPHIEPHATVHALDRRGRGASGDAPDYRLAREFEDVAAVVDAVAEAAGGPVDLYGHSFGGLCAFGAATLTGNVRRLVLYEGWPAVDPAAHDLPPHVAERLDAQLAAGDREGALVTVFRELVGMPDDELAPFRAQPSWQARLAAVHTISRELRAIHEAPFDPARARRITAPTLLVTGSDSSDPARADLDVVAAALANAQVAGLEGQGHVADVLAPDVFAPPVVAFLRAGS